jgi:hypothetical protein
LSTPLFYLQFTFVSQTVQQPSDIGGQRSANVDERPAPWISENQSFGVQRLPGDLYSHRQLGSFP